MSQDSVLQLLKKKKEWMTAKEIAKVLHITPGAVRKSLEVLLLQGIVKKKTKENPLSYSWRLERIPKYTANNLKFSGCGRKC